MYYKEKKFNLGKIIAIVLSIIVLMIIIGIISTIIIGNMKDKNLTQEVVRDLPTPTLDLAVNTTAPNQDSVTITAKGSVAKNIGIKAITLLNDPSGVPKEIIGDIGKFVVTDNGEYKFVVKDNNGQVFETKIAVNNIRAKRADKPYIPDGFKVISEDYNSGIVIEDKFKNQFVWVPVREGKIQSAHSFDSRYTDNETGTSEFLNSVGLYKGFYISRYEISRGIDREKNVYIPLSQEGKIPWTLISYDNALIFAQKMAESFGYKNVKTSIPSGHAWQAIIDVVDQVSNGQFSKSVDKGNHSGRLKKTGETKSDLIYNIYDLAGNVREWTSESLLIGSTANGVSAGTTIGSEQQTKTKVLRGGSADISGSLRQSANYTPDQVNNTWGYRVVMYK